MDILMARFIAIPSCPESIARVTVRRCNLTILALALIPSHTLSQTAFNQLPDATGYADNIPQHTLDSLESASQSLREALPQEFQSDFAVYDLGFYSHHRSFTGGIPDVITNVITNHVTHPYYLLFGREMDDEGGLKKVWVEVELPEGEWLLECFNQTYIDVFKASIRTKAEELFKQYNNQGMFAFAKIHTISYFAEKLGDLANCCDPSAFRQQQCELCETTEEIYVWLMDHGFEGVDVSNVTSGLPDNSFNNVVDHCGIYIDGVSLAHLANETLGNIAGMNNTTATAYITNNDNFCTGTMDVVLLEYAADLTDFDVWIHYWNYTINNVQILFVRADFYLLLDDPVFIEYYDEPEPPAFQDTPGRSQDPGQPETQYLIIDPETGSHYYSDKIEPLPISGGEGMLSYIPSQLTHTVQSGDNLTKIVEEWGDGFNISDLIQWNPAKLEDENTILQVGWDLIIYDEADQDLLTNEFHIWGYTIPILPLENYNLISRDAHPDIGFQPVPGSPVQNFKQNLRNRPTISIPNPNGHGQVKDIIKDPGKWDIMKWFKTNAGKVIFTCGRIGSTFLTVMLTPQTVQDASLNYMWEWEFRDRIAFHKKIETEENDDKLTYVTYTKYNPEEQNISPLTPGKVYVGRTSGYNKNPLILIRLRDYGHHKKDQGYQKACYDHHEYSTTGSRANRHQDPAYKIIRGREQVIIESMGGAWSDNKGIDGVRNTRSGNEINGIDRKKWPNFYAECKYLALNAAIIINPNEPPINWVPPCEEWQKYLNW